MTIIEALLTIAIRYCSDKIDFWLKKHNNQSCEDKQEAPHARWVVLWSISQEIQTIIDKPFDTVEECLSELTLIGNYALNDFASWIKGGAGISAMNDERQKFIECINNISDKQLANVDPLPYSRKLSIAESKEVRGDLNRIWDFDGRYWNPLEDKYKGEIFFIMTRYVTQADMDKILQFLAPDKESHYYEVDELRNDYETEIIDINLRVAETVYTNKTFEWIIYVSHEGSNPVIRNVLKMKEPTKKITALSKPQVESLYAAATNIRDRFLIKLLFETGLRIGEALSLFVEDFLYDAGGEHKIRLVSRGELINGARLKSGDREVHVSRDLMDLFDDYMYTILDELDADTNFVFVKLKGKNRGEPMTYPDVNALFKTLRGKTGLSVHPHLLRHTHATMYYRNTKDIKQVQERLGHAQIQTTLNMYLHPSEEELRENWERAQSAFRMTEGG